MRVTLCLLTCSFLIASCTKNKDKEPDVAAQITISAPIAGTIFLNGTALQIRGNATDDNVLASVTCTIRNTTSNAILYNRILPTSNVGYFDFAQDWTITGITGITPARLIVTTTDKVGYTATKEVNIQLTD
jgi:hypothetical protein